MTRTEANSVKITKRFAVSPGEVWRAWTAAEVVRQWFGSDPKGTVIAARLEVRLGGSFEVSFVDSDGTEHTCKGQYEEVQPNSLLAFSWSWKSEPGHVSQVSVRFTPAGASTEMDFEHRNLSPGSSHNYEEGWRRTFLKLERILAASASGQSSQHTV